MTMPTNVDDIIRKLSSAQRKKVEARASPLIAEEMTLRFERTADSPYYSKATEQQGCQGAASHARGHRFESFRAHHSVVTQY